MDTVQYTNELLKGHTDAIILGILEDRDHYGYEIAKEVFARSKKHYEMKEPTLYSSLKRLEKNGFITSYWGDESEGGRRKYYAISSSGQKMLKDHIENWVRAQKILKNLLKDKNGK